MKSELTVSFSWYHLCTSFIWLFPCHHHFLKLYSLGSPNINNTLWHRFKMTLFLNQVGKLLLRDTFLLNELIDQCIHEISVTFQNLQKVKYKNKSSHSTKNSKQHQQETDAYLCCSSIAIVKNSKCLQINVLMRNIAIDEIIKTERHPKSQKKKVIRSIHRFDLPPKNRITHNTFLKDHQEQSSVQLIWHCLPFLPKLCLTAKNQYHTIYFKCCSSNTYRMIKSYNYLQ